MKKKFVVLIVLVLFSCLVFLGCGGNNGTDNGGSEGNDDNNQTQEILPYYAPVKSEITERILVAPLASHYFEFIPEYTSDYTITIDTSYKTQLFVNDIEVASTNNRFSAYLKANKLYWIKIKITEGSAGAYADLIIQPSFLLNEIRVEKESSYLLKTLIGGIKRLSLSDQNINLTNIYRADKTAYNRYGFFRSPNHYEYCDGFDYGAYYIVLKNTTQEDKTVNLNIEEITETINMDTPKNLTVSDKRRFIKFYCETGGQYFLNFSEEGGYSYSAFNASGGFMIVSSWSTGGASVSLNPNQTYYFGISLSDSEEKTATLTVTKQENCYKWEITGGPAGTIITYESIVYLKCGYDYTFKFWVNEEYYETVIRVTEIDLMQNIGETLSLPFGDGKSYYVSAEYSSIALFTHTLYVIPI